MQRKIILFEVNEIPFKVIDAYCNMRPFSTLAEMLGQSRQYLTFTEDKLALDPWISWPTLHRGVNDETHNILHLGQVDEESDSAYPPIWRLLHRAGLTVGIFGSLHSSNVPSDFSEYCFYLPDYFGTDIKVHPPSLASFQELNLSMTRQSARNVSRRIPFGATINFLLNAPRMGISLSTLTDTARHLVQEVFDSSKRIRRRAYQPLMMMDLFIKQLEKTKPQFATFYTNHVAAAMHRYWGATFPEDYGSHPMEDVWIRRYSSEIWFAMDKLDLMIARLRNFVDADDSYTLVVASSMGQAAIPAQSTADFLTITDIERFMQSMGVPKGSWEQRPAMVPCCCVVVSDSCRDVFINNIASLKIGETSILPRKKPTGPMSFDERERGFFQIFIQHDSYRGPHLALVQSEQRDFQTLGLGMMSHEDGVNCTAQHVADGSLFVYPARERNSATEARPRVSTLDVVPSLLKFFGLEKGAYMPGNPNITLERTG